MTILTETRLAPEQIAHYRRDGFVRRVFPALVVGLNAVLFPDWLARSF